MKQLQYASAAIAMHFDFPEEWNSELITAVDISITDRDGVKLLSADECTLWTQVTLDGSVSRYSSEIALNNISEAVPPSTPAVPPDALLMGDMLLIKGAAGDEIHRVKGYSSTTRVAGIDGIFENDHDDNDKVWARFCNYELDISDTDVFTNGIVIQVHWTPTGSGNPVTEQYQVMSSALDLSGLRQDMADRYSRVYNAFTVPVDKFSRMSEMAEKDVMIELRGAQPPIDIQKIVDQDLAKGAIMARMATIWTLSGDEQLEDERKKYLDEYAYQIGILKSSVFWLDANLDNVEDEEEITSREPIFTRGW
jgi:hypothetical protein